MGKRLWACFLTVLLLVTVWAVPIWGADGESLDEALQGIVTYYEDNKTDLDNWEEVVGLSEAGVDLSAGPWGLPDWDIDALDQDSYPADYATIILGMWAAGEDPMDAGGRDLTAELADLQDEDGNFGTRLHDTIWSMVALDRAGASYDTAAASAYLLAQQTSDGGWALGGDSADPDMTGFALIALGSHQDEDGVRNGINAALYCLQDLQLDSGGFSSGIENTESIASVIRGLVACDEDIIGEDWIKTDQTMIDALFAFQLEDYSFAHGEGGSSNAMATRQALIAVADMVNAGIDYTIGGGGDGGDDPEEATVRVRVEGAADELLDAEVDVAGSALDALAAAAGAGNVTISPDGLVTEILGESGQNNVAPGIDTSWFYYVVRDGGIEPNAFDYGPDGYPVEDGDEVIFYIGAYDSSTWAGKTYLPVVSVSPDNPTAGGSLTISITAWKYDWMTGLQELSDDEKTAIGEYTVTAAGDEYTSSGGQVTIDDLTAGTLDYQISNAGEYGYPDVVTCKGSVEVEPAAIYSVRVRVEGAADELLDAEVDVAGTALDALVAAAGAGNVTAPGGFVSEILGESGQADVAPGTDTSWFFYVLRDGDIEPNAFNEGPGTYLVEDGDEVIFYIGAYDNSTWAGKTYLPVVSVSPDNPTAGGSLTISITAWKYDWMTGLQELSDDEKTAIGEYTVTAAGDEYTSSDGQVTIDDLTAGTLDYQISNAGEYGYPDVVTYKGSVIVEEDTQSPTQTDYITVKIAVVGGAGNLLYGPREVKVYDSDEYGYTAMGALDATGLSWTMSNSADGFITEIGGEENEGMNGWMYSINGTNPSDVPMYEDVEDGDKVIFWYSMDITEDGPSWDDVLDLSDNPPSHPEGLREAKLIFSRYEYELKSLKKESEVWNQENRLSPSELKRLKKMLDGNRVDFTGDIDEEGGYLVDSDDMEVAILVPENAVDRSLTITIEELAAGEAQQQIGIKILSSVYEFGPSPLEFNKPVTICFKVAIDEDVDLDSLTPAWWDEANQKWVPIPAIIDLEYGLVIFRVDHFSQYALLSIGPVPAAAAPRVTFPDVGEDMAWARDAIEILAGQGIIMGTDAGLFEPHRPITRAEFIQIIANARGLEPSTGLDGIFSDVYPVDWFAPAVVAAFNNRIVTGSPDGTFKPGQEISRAEVAVIFANMSPETVIDQIAGLSYQDIHTIPTWAFRAVKFTHQQGLMSGYEDGTFRGNGPLTRAEAAVIMYNYLNLIAADQ